MNGKHEGPIQHLLGAVQDATTAIHTLREEFARGDERSKAAAKRMGDIEEKLESVSEELQGFRDLVMRVFWGAAGIASFVTFGLATAATLQKLGVIG